MNKTLTQSQQKGRLILIGALALVGLPLIYSTLKGLNREPSEMLGDFVGLGTWLLILFFAFRGGSTSLGILKIASIFFAVVCFLSLPLGGLVVFKDSGRTGLYSFLAHVIPATLGSAFIVWALFLSGSVQDFILRTTMDQARPVSRN